VSDHRVKISVKSDHHALPNLSSNPTDKVTEFDSNLECKICPISLLNLAPKLKFAENRQGTPGILDYPQSFKLFVGTYITFLKGYDAGILMNSKKFKN
jgi:hypothetical protein